MYAVLKWIDQYRPGQIIDGAQYSAGNLAGLLRSGSIAPVEVPRRSEPSAPTMSMAQIEEWLDANPLPAKDLSGMTVAELREMAKAAEVDGYSKMRKADLIAALGA